MFVVSTDPNDTPVRADGSRYPHLFLAPTGEAVFADSLSEIIEQIVVGYAGLATIEERLLALVDSLVEFATDAQAASFLSAPNIDELGEDELAAVFAPKDGPVQLEVWSHGFPLILLITSYAPFTEAPSPKGQSIVWLDPVNERTYLESLTALGIGELMVAEEI